MMKLDLGQLEHVNAVLYSQEILVRKYFKMCKCVSFYTLTCNCHNLVFCVYVTARYQSDLEGKEAIKLAERFYFEAALINPDIGKINPPYFVAGEFTYSINFHMTVISILWLAFVSMILCQDFVQRIKSLVYLSLFLHSLRSSGWDIL